MCQHRVRHCTRLKAPYCRGAGYYNNRGSAIRVMRSNSVSRRPWMHTSRASVVSMVALITHGRPWKSRSSRTHARRSS